MVIDEKFETLVREISSLRAGSLKLLCLENFSEELAEKEDKLADKFIDKEFISHSKIKSSQDKKWFDVYWKHSYFF